MEDKFEEERQRIILANIEALGEQTHLAQQSLENLDLEAITPLTPEIISR